MATQQTRRRFLRTAVGAVGTAGLAGTATAEAASRDPDALVQTFRTKPEPVFEVSYPRSWKCYDDAIMNMLDPRQLFWIVSEPIPKQALEIGFPDLSRATGTIVAIAAREQTLAEAEHPEHAIAVSTAISLLQFEQGLDAGANGAVFYQQWFAFGDAGVQIFAWLGSEADTATADAVLASLRRV